LLIVYVAVPLDGGVTAGAVIERFDVVEDGISKFDAGAPFLPVQKFYLHGAPKRLDNRIVLPCPAH